MNDEIEWLNSLEIQSCSLVTCLDDLRSGVVLCDLAAYLKSRPNFADVHRHGSFQQNPKKASINNFKIFLREIGARLPPSLLRTPEELYSDHEILQELVRYLKKLISKPNLQENTQWPYSRNLTPRQLIPSSPGRLTHRLQHSPSMIDIHIHPSSVQDPTKESIKNWLVDLKLIKYDVVEEIKDGVVLCELVNRLEGKCEVIKGVNKAPKSKSAIQVNIGKALGYLRGIEKMESKYLWSVGDIMQGDEETIFGLLKGLKEFYSIKRSASVSRSAKILPCKYLSPSRVEAKPEVSNAKVWVMNMGLGQYLENSEKKHFIDDPCRNGILLYEIIGKIEGIDVPGIVRPKSLASAQNNYEKIFKVIFDRYPNIARKYFKSIEEFIEDESILWELIEDLVAVPRITQKSSSDMPYLQDQTTQLKTSITSWVNSTLNRIFDNFESLLPDLSSGLLLSELILKCNLPLTGITKAPKTQKIKQSNIDKCLESLRKSSRMSQLYLWKTSEISEGEPQICLLLLEDLHRFFDGLPARKRGPNYHYDGPYLPKPSKFRVSPLKNISSLLNKSYESPRTCCSTRRIREDPKPKIKFLNFDNIADSNEFEWLFSFDVSVDMSLEVLEEFKSGVLLCGIVEKLERKVISGVESRVRSNAVALFNVGKAMKILREKPTFPSSLMFVDEEVVRGKGDAIRSLMRAIFKIYREVIRTQLGRKN